MNNTPYFKGKNFLKDFKFRKTALLWWFSINLYTTLVNYSKPKHYYFPTKADLGTEIIKNTIQNFHNAVNNWKQYPYEIQLKHWILLYADSRKKNWVCITGALSPVFDTLPTKMQVQLQILVNDIFNWLEEVLSKGKEAGVFHFNESPQLKAHIIQSLLLASLLLDKVVAKDIYEEMKSHILGN